MKLIDKKNKVKVEKDDLTDAKLSSLDFPTTDIRKRAYANVLAARLAMKFLFSQKIEATNLYSLYTIHNILEQFDIADVYFQNIKLDVRLVFSPNEIFVPKSHLEYGLTPDIYLVLLVRENFSSVEFLGFFDAEDINKENANEDFYFYEYDLLQSPEKLKSFLGNYTPKKHFNTPEPVGQELEELLLAFVDKELPDKDNRFVIEQLATNFSLREKLVEFENFELVSKEVAKDASMLQDGFLDIVGAQKVFEEEDSLQSLSEAKAEIEAEVLLADILNDDPEDISNDTLATGAAGFGAGLIAGAGLAAAGLASTGLTPLPDIDFGEINIGDMEINTGNQDQQKQSDSVSFAENLSDDQDETNDFEFIGEDRIDDEIEISAEPESQTIEQELESEDEKFDGILPPLDDESAFLDLEETVPAYLKQEPAEVLEEVLSKNEELDSENFDEPLPVLEFSEEEAFEELPEIEGFKEFEEQPEDSQENKNKDDDEVVNIENFNFDELNKDTDSQEENLAQNQDYSLTPLGDKETDTLQEFNKLESEEEEQENVTAIGASEESTPSDDLIFQVEEFLNSVDLSDEQKSALENTLASGFDVPTNISVSTEEEPDVIFLPNDDDDQEDIINRLSQPQSQSDSQNESDLLQVLFEKEQINEDNPPKAHKENILANLSKNKKMVIAASVASVVLVTFVAGGAIISNNKNNANIQASQIKTQEQPIQQGQADPTQPSTDPSNINAGMNGPNQPGAQAGMPPIDQAMAQGPQEIPGENQAATRGDMGKAVSDAFLSEPVNASVSKVAWEVPEDLAFNDSFRKYLQMAGRNMKLNLQNNLLLSTEMAYSNKVIVDLNINASGGLQSSNISVSSGSKQIDKIVLQSVKDTLSYLKMPSSELGGRSSVLTLIINF